MPSMIVPVVLLVLAALLTACGTRSSVPPPPSSLGTPTDQTLPAQLLNQPLLDPTGKPTTLAGYRGKVLVVSDMMTLCQETCPLDTANLVATARAVQRAGLADRVEFASITVDPNRDTPSRLAAYQRLFAPAPADWALLTGSPAALAALWKQLGVYWQKVPEDSPAGTDWLTGQPMTYDINHSDLIFFFDPSSHERFVIDGAGHVEPGTPIPPQLRQFLDDQGHDKLNHPGLDSWTVPQALKVIAWLLQQPIPGGRSS